jgi:hypothetical protein
MADPAPPWRPTSISLPSEPLRTDTMPVAVETDLGGAYLKPLWTADSGNWLAREMIGLRLAIALGLEAPLCSVYDVSGFETPEDRDENPSLEGPALLIQRIEWAFWDGTPASLKLVSNKLDIAGLVVLDTWLRNTDRYPPVDAGLPPPDPNRANLQNVALSRDPARNRRSRLRAVDFNRTLHAERILDPQKLGPDAVTDERIYGLFPAFRAAIRRTQLEHFVAKLDALPSEVIRAIVNEVPDVWWPAPAARDATEAFLMQRREMVRSKIVSLLRPALGWLNT